MRINRETLLKIAQETTVQRTRSNREIIAVYLCGSLLQEEFMLGGTADIDLVIIHNDQPPTEREIVRLSDEVHLDIAHHVQKDYRQTRTLKEHPWLGPTLNTCKVLHDPQHFLDFTQASVRGQFDRSDHVLQRAHQQAEKARQIWISLQSSNELPGVKEIASYLRALWQAANAVASLSGQPLTERRLLLNFPTSANAVGHSGLQAGLLGLLGAPSISVEALWGCLAAWQSAFQELPSENTPVRLHIERRLYYYKAFDAFLSSAQPQAVLWPLLRTWTQMAGLLPTDSKEYQDWLATCLQLGLAGDGFAERLAALDSYLDLVDETIEEWGRANGA